MTLGNGLFGPLLGASVLFMLLSSLYIVDFKKFCCNKSVEPNNV